MKYMLIIGTLIVAAAASVLFIWMPFKNIETAKVRE
jgi:hypothetical protein